MRDAVWSMQDVKQAKIACFYFRNIPHSAYYIPHMLVDGEAFLCYNGVTVQVAGIK